MHIHMLCIHAILGQRHCWASLLKTATTKLVLRLLAEQIWLQYDGPTLGRPAGRGSFPEDLVQLLAQHPDAASVGLSSQISAGSNASQLAHLLQVRPSAMYELVLRQQASSTVALACQPDP